MFEAGAKVQRNRDDARYTGIVTGYNEETGKYGIEWPVREANGDLGTLVTELPENELRAAQPTLAEQEEMLDMAARKTAEEVAGGVRAEAQTPAGKGKQIRSKAQAIKAAEAEKAAGSNGAKADAGALVPVQKGKGGKEPSLFTKLNREEQALLKKCEATIKDGVASFVAVGTALATIRDNRLYREKYDSWERYCTSEWDLHRRFVDYQIAGSSTYREIEAAAKVRSADEDGQGLTPIALPANEAQVRPLLALKDPGERLEAWIEAVQAAPDGRVTAALVQAAVDKRTKDTGSEPASPAGDRVSRATLSSPTPDEQAADAAGGADGKVLTILWDGPYYYADVDGSRYQIKKTQEGKYNLSADDFYIGEYDTSTEAGLAAEEFRVQQARQADAIGVVSEETDAAVAELEREPVEA